jgi:hypothetical protein
MSEPRDTAFDRRVNQTLLVGLYLSAGTAGAGLLLSFAGVGWSDALIRLGLALLIASPVVRLIASLATAVRTRDHLLAWSAAVVLAAMVVSLVLHARPRG